MSVKPIERTEEPSAVIESEISKAVRIALLVSGAAAMLSISPLVISQSDFEAVLELSDLDGSNGFIISGINAGDNSGWSVSGAGDVNGDGVDDVIIGARDATSNGNIKTGQSYVVFGSSSVGSAGNIVLADLDGSNGFVVNGNGLGNYSGSEVSDVGDVNGDGLDDLFIWAYGGRPGGRSRAGEYFVLFGAINLGSAGAIELSDLDGTDGFVINGIDVDDHFIPNPSTNVAGDINGDGVFDLIIGAAGADPNESSFAGETYVVFGGNGVGSEGEIELSALNGSNGFVINGIDVSDGSGFSVSGAGDFNGDGVDDLVIGAPLADPAGNSAAGEAYVVFGGSSVGDTGVVELTDIAESDGSVASSGFVIAGTFASDELGRSVSSAGDFNEDGFDDIILGAAGAGIRSGKSYVLFGNATLNPVLVTVQLLGSNRGFEINGADPFDSAGHSVSSAGDINGDGVVDVIIGAVGASPNGIGAAGASYVLFGGSGVSETGPIELSVLDGSDGFVINGIAELDQTGDRVSAAGDINGDGVDDLLIGAYRADPNGNANAGQSYILFGRGPSLCNGLPVTVDLNLGQTPGPNDDVVMGTPDDDDIRGRAGNDTICGEGGDDFIHGNSGDDWIDGGHGVDNIRGGQGDDVLFSGSGATAGTPSRVFGGNGIDIITGGPDADDLRGGRDDDVISGLGGADTIIGNEGNDDLSGGEGDDAITGGQGNDVLIGDEGVDSLNGGTGGMDFCDAGGQAGDSNVNCELF